jgi:hypothetical protein
MTQGAIVNCALLPMKVIVSESMYGLFTFIYVVSEVIDLALLAIVSAKTLLLLGRLLANRIINNAMEGNFVQF